MANTPSHDYVGEKAPAAGKPVPGKPGSNPLMLVLSVLASMRVTIVLFSLSLVLVFMGTLAQKHAGIERVLKQYFYCWKATVDLNLISDFTEIFGRFRLMGTLKDPVTANVPFPGGYLIGWAMVINLTAAHIVRFRLGWKRSGIWILHFGMVVLLGGEFIRAEMGHEDRMTLREGGSADFMFDLNHVEMTIAKPSTGETTEVITIPGEILSQGAPDEKRRKEAGRIDLPDVPFHLRTLEYMINSSEPRVRGADEPAQATNGVGRAVTIKPAKEVSGTDAGGRVNFPAAIVEFVANDGGASLGTYLIGVLLEEPQKLVVAGQTYHVNFRMRRTHLPYKITAEKIENDYYPGTEIPRNYSSTIRLTDPRNQEDREVTIWMNHPLRYDGATFYQSSMETFPGDVKRTGLQVVRNPGWLWPYVSCSLVGLGMLIHFGIKFGEFLKKKAAAEKRAALKTANA